MKQHRYKYLNKLTLRTEQLEHQYTYEDIFILLKGKNLIKKVEGINITKKGFKFELKVIDHSTFYDLFQNGIRDTVNDTLIKLKPLIPPIVINVTNVPLTALSCMVEKMILDATQNSFAHVYAQPHLVTFEGKHFCTGRWVIHAWRYGTKGLPPLPTHSTFFYDRYVSLHYHTSDKHPTPTNHTFTPFYDSSDDEEDDLTPLNRDDAQDLDILPPPPVNSTSSDRQPPPETPITPPKSPANLTPIKRQPPPGTAITPPKSPATSTSTDRQPTPETIIEPPIAPAKPPSIDRPPIPDTTNTPVTVPLATNHLPHMDEVPTEIPPEIHKVVTKPHFYYEHIHSNTSNPIKIIRRWKVKDRTYRK